LPLSLAALPVLHRFWTADGSAETLDRLGDTRRALGDEPAAREAWAGALHILTELRHPLADRVRAKLD
jgi:hypothetical protein